MGNIALWLYWFPYSIHSFFSKCKDSEPVRNQPAILATIFSCPISQSAQTVRCRWVDRSIAVATGLTVDFRPPPSNFSLNLPDSWLQVRWPPLFREISSIRYWLVATSIYPLLKASFSVLISKRCRVANLYAATRQVGNHCWILNWCLTLYRADKISKTCLCPSVSPQA